MYSDASTDRIVTALELYRLIRELFADAESQRNDSVLWRLTETMLSASTVVTLLNCLSVSWDRVRILSSSILSSFPAPLNGYHTRRDVYRLIFLAVQWIQSARSREADGGALILRLLFT